MLKWLNRQPVSVEIVNPVEDLEMMNRIESAESRIGVLEKKLRSVEDHFEELDYKLKEEITSLTELLVKAREDLNSTMELCQKVENLVKATAGSTVSKSEFIDFVNTLADAVKEARSRLDLPF